jgi:energy-coupling factor transporter ATP-binding protein EcfA2
LPGSRSDGHLGLPQEFPVRRASRAWRRAPRGLERRAWRLQQQAPAARTRDGRRCAALARPIPVGKCILFGGHRGCGKSTELRAIAAELAGPERFLVVSIDALQALDINNLTYADVALALAEALAASVEQAGITVPEVFLTPLHEWFREVSRNTALTTSLTGEIKAGVKAETGLPFVGKLFASLTAAIRSNTTYKTEIRESVRNSFSVLARGFNQLLSFVESEVSKHGKGHAVIFVVDGTDRLRGDEADDFFVRDSHQLRQLRGNCIYCAPIGVLNEQGQVGQNFDAIFRLPMVKLAEKGQPSRCPSPGSACASSSTGACRRKTSTTRRPWTGSSRIPAATRATCCGSSTSVSRRSTRDRSAARWRPPRRGG